MRNGTSSSPTSKNASCPPASAPAPSARPASTSTTRIRCSLLRPDPAQRSRLAEIRANLHDRIAEAEREGWLGEIEGLKVSLAGADDKLAQIDAALRRQATTVQLGMPAFPDTVPHPVPADR
jgi:hypothetical protein